MKVFFLLFLSLGFTVIIHCKLHLKLLITYNFRKICCAGICPVFIPCSWNISYMRIWGVYSIYGQFSYSNSWMVQLIGLNEHLHVGRTVQDLARMCWEALEHPPFISDLFPRDYKFQNNLSSGSVAVPRRCWGRTYYIRLANSCRNFTYWKS